MAQGGASRRRQTVSITQRYDRTVATSNGHPPRVTCLERCLVADLLYVLLTIGVFVVLALTLRGMEKL